ncbi:MAG: hypothetical protein ACLFWM_04055 [Actinomycetota bacterium]
MAREIRRPTSNPLAVATAIDLLRAYADGTAPATDLEEALAASLQRVDPDRERSRRLVRNFDAIPSGIKTPVFGATVRGQMRTSPETDLEALFARPPLGIAFRDDVTLGDPPEYPEDTQFTVLYTGLYCNDRTGDRQILGPSDEPYVITVAVSIDEDGENVERSELHPVGDPDNRYGDVDDGEYRKGPIAACWAGTLPSQELSIVTVVMENDEGDPEAYRQEVETLVNVAAAIAAYFNIAIGAAIKALAADLILWLIDSGDDEIGTDIAIITPEWLRRYPHEYPVRKFTGTRTELVPVGFFQWEEQEIEDVTDLDYQFITRHEERGRYVVTYKVDADRDPLTRPQTLTDIGERPILVARSL